MNFGYSIWLIAWFCLYGAVAWGAGPSDAADPAMASSDAVSGLEARLGEARRELGRVASEQSISTNPPPGATAAEAAGYRSVLGSTVRAYEEHIVTANRLEAARQRQLELQQKAQRWTGFSEPPPYSILFVDGLRDSIYSLETRVASSEDSTRAIAAFEADGEEELKQSDRQLRLLVERVEAAKGGVQSERLVWQRTLEQARNRLATANVALNATRRLRVLAELAEDRLRLALLQRQLALAKTQVRFSQADLDQALARLDGEMQELEVECKATEGENAARQAAVAKARTDLNQALQVVAAGTVEAAAGRREVHRLQGLLDLRNAQAEAEAERLTVLWELQELNGSERGMWQLRFAAFGIRDLAKIQQGYAGLERLNRLMQAAKPHFAQQLELASNLIAAQRARILDPSSSQEDLDRAQQFLDCHQRRKESARRALEGLAKLERLSARWQESLDLDRRDLPAAARVRYLFTGVSSFAVRLWQFELFTVADTIIVDGQPITGRRQVTVGKVVMAVLILIVGYWAATGVARLLERIAVSRFKIDATQGVLVRRWARIFLVLGAVIFSLISAKIPLTVFAFLGGALAIGLGFGTQTILKNFISGIIILFERSFRVGDVLDVGDRRGTITNIGIRASLLQLWDGTEVVIPNSVFLENQVINWTYSSPVVRFSVEVGVAYGTDTRRVAQLLEEVGHQHGLVRKEPKPQVLFKEFADSSLTFEFRYWLNVREANAAQVASDLRHMIGIAFAQDGIVIAFPQRDLHLDAARPLAVRIVPPAEAGPRAAPE